MQIEGSIQKVLEEVAAFLPLFPSGGRLELREEKLTPLTKSCLPFALDPFRAFLCGLFLMLPLPRVSFGQSAGEFTGFLNDTARVVFVAREMKGGPVGGDVDNLADEFVIRAGLGEFFKNVCAALPLGDGITGRRVAAFDKMPDERGRHTRRAEQLIGGDPLDVDERGDGLDREAAGVGIQGGRGWVGRHGVKTVIYTVVQRK